MFFTEEDYKKIEKYLASCGVKDSCLEDAKLPIEGNEKIAIVQNGENRILYIRELIEALSNSKASLSDLYNVTDHAKEKYINLKQAIELVPYKARKIGQIITFLNPASKWELYQFQGTSILQWNELSLWNDFFNLDSYVIKSILPDEEDLTKSENDGKGNSYLSLKDREYNPDEFSGLGKVILRKNIMEVETEEYGKVKKNVLLQDMINKPNTIYEIRYDFDLNNQEITIPEGCVLDFQGGSLSNGVLLNYNNIKSIRGVIKLELYISLEGNYGIKKCPIKTLYSKANTVNNIITGIRYMEVYYANKYNVPIILNYNINTPSRYGAKGDLITDDTNSLQAALDIISFYGGNLNLTSFSNNMAKGYLISKPLVIKASNQPEEGYLQRPLISSIYSDYNNEYSGKGAFIKAINIPETRGAIELQGFGNGWPNVTSINNLYIDATDISNNKNSFALRFEDGRDNKFYKCFFNGWNGVLDISGMDEISYSKINILWELCTFNSINNERGWSLSMGEYYGLGRQNGDNELFLNCSFGATLEVSCFSISLIQCMFSVKVNKDKGTAEQLGFIRANDVNLSIDFSTCIQIIRGNIGVYIEKCYFEDLNIGIDVSGFKYPYNIVPNIVINQCYINGYTNQKEKLLADCGLLINEQLDETANIKVLNTYFRFMDYGYKEEAFTKGAILNNSKKANIMYNNLRIGYNPDEYIQNLKKYKGPIILNDKILKIQKELNFSGYLNTVYQEILLNKYIINNIYFQINNVNKTTYLNKIYLIIKKNNTEIYQSNLSSDKYWDESTNSFLCKITPKEKLYFDYGDNVLIEINMSGAEEHIIKFYTD